jgi:16S rRNA (guanine527-N7)-methyltransferase
MEPDPSADRLNELLKYLDIEILQTAQYKQLKDYLSLILRWNARTNLTSVRDPEAILSRHFVESIACAYSLPPNITTLLDFGSGAGFPGIPISICRPELTVTLAESQGKKAAFLQEAVRVTGIKAKVHSARAETLTTQFDCVTLRAVDHMNHAVREATRLVASRGWLALMITQADLPVFEATAGPAFLWSKPLLLPGSDTRILALARKSEV